MGSKSSSTSTPINQQLSSGAANNVTGNSGATTIFNQLNDFGAVQGGLNLGQSAVSMAGTAAEAAMMANSAIANNSMTNATLQSAAGLQAMLLSSQSSNAAAAAASEASSVASMNAARDAVNSSYGTALLTTQTAQDYMNKAGVMTNNVMATTQDQLSKVLGAVSSNSLAMVSSSTLESETTEAMTQKLLIGVGLVAAVMILKGR